MNWRNYFGITLLICLVFSTLRCKSPAVKQEAGTGDTFKSWAPTPPMGWNSWDCYGPTVREDEVMANADYMAANLAAYGWQYIVVDIRWFVENTKAGGYNQTDPSYVIDEYGRYLPAINRFPSAANGHGFTNLANYLHEKGLKFGIHIMRGIPKIAVENKLPILNANGITADQIYSPEMQCEWLRDNYTIVADKPGAQEYYNSIFNLYAAWGVDFVKVDDIARPYHQAEIDLIRNAIDQCGRNMVLSLSPGATPLSEAEHVQRHANMWRMVDDVWDTWPHIQHLMEIAPQWYPYIASGTWPDCDMIPLGRISLRGERGPDRMTRLTPLEQYSLMTLFTISKSPLFYGGDLPSNDPFTLSLLTNEAVLKMHRESDEVRKLSAQDSTLAIVSNHPGDHTVYLALFNQSTTDKIVPVDLRETRIVDSCQITNLWTGEALGSRKSNFEVSLAPHASVLFHLTH
ncbi:MAG TPA: glycoside hydrolase family 27 protein [Saprospiraceae bacterium]|nr:glycoside hydrolase family 27 protein [Saprospiraceae bacterium]